MVGTAGNASAAPRRSSGENGLWREPMARVVVEDEQGEDGPTWVLDIEQVSAVESHFIARVKSEVTVAAVSGVIAFSV